ncbi:hypothetical protein [Chryseolinea lacunae]|uniref:Uncharacterized protein n=1 Tax=Chryseolinea lacunae TaxID=2801331 RepID=A0ABS1L176_9BACT|nr:hypothetical protein [Chryseolinea lacunae]MBL0744682.1 hypothetical protein [Chryseolinea lacunae]
MEIVMKKTPWAYCLCLVLFLSGCTFISTPIERNDVYAQCAKGDTISFELFKKTQSIKKTDKWYLIWLDLYKDGGDQYAPHLLVCDHNLVLKGATGVYPEIIKVKGDTLFCITSEEYIAEKNKSVKPYRDDLPKEIVLSLKEREKTWNGYQRNPSAVVDSIQLLQNSVSAKFYLKTSDSIYFPGRKQYFEDIVYYSKAFKKVKILEFPVSSLHFDRSEKYIYVIDDNDVQFEMHTLDNKVFEKVILNIWQAIKK